MELCLINTEGKSYWNLKITAGATGSAEVKVDGTNLGTNYWTRSRMLEISGDTSRTGRFSAASDDTGLFNTTSASDIFMGAFLPIFSVLDDTTTITIRSRTSDAGETTTFSNVTLDIIYVPFFTED